eukprot:GAHX01000091.1.p1 GENE.GAHX01000091.1~~GAHX01000091.1.p1  ORF type:complete len:255 (-),score=50.45 GAHX01000091.1:81-845(-)
MSYNHTNNNNKRNALPNEFRIKASGDVNEYVERLVEIFDSISDSVAITGVGRSIPVLIKVVELLKGRVDGLAQINEIKTIIDSDTYVNNETQIKREKYTEKPYLSIILSKRDLNKNHSGYQFIVHHKKRYPREEYRQKEYRPRYERSERTERSDRYEYDSRDRGDRFERDRGDKFDRERRPERNNRYDRSERNERSERNGEFRDKGRVEKRYQRKQKSESEPFTYSNSDDNSSSDGFSQGYSKRVGRRNNKKAW